MDKDCQTGIKDNSQRERLAVRAGVVGIVCNTLLCAVKFIIGLITGSVSVTADAINNLSDAGSNVVSLAGAKLSGKPVDKEHPFGHGRIEYISALIVAIMIFVMGFELVKGSVEKLINPSPVAFSFWYLLLLAAAVLVKLFLAFYNHRLYMLTGNLNLKAVKKDCINDSISTAATTVALLIGEYTSFKAADALMGIAVSGLIIAAGVSVVRDIIGPLLGQAPSRELVEEIETLVVSKSPILGVHDLIVHDYGPGRRIASVHAEVPSSVDLVEIHDLIDNIEVEIFEKLGILMCIHIDPLVTGDERVNRYRELTMDIIREINEEYSFHDFRMVQGPTHTNLLFDLVVPASEKGISDGQVLGQLRERFRQQDPTVKLVVRVEHSYI